MLALIGFRLARLLQIFNHNVLLSFPHLTQDLHADHVHAENLLSSNLHLFAFFYTCFCHILKIENLIRFCKESSDFIHRHHFHLILFNQTYGSQSVSNSVYIFYIQWLIGKDTRETVPTLDQFSIADHFSMIAFYLKSFEPLLLESAHQFVEEYDYLESGGSLMLILQFFKPLLRLLDLTSFDLLCIEFQITFELFPEQIGIPLSHAIVSLDLELSTQAFYLLFFILIEGWNLCSIHGDKITWTFVLLLHSHLTFNLSFSPLHLKSKILAVRILYSFDTIGDCPVTNFFVKESSAEV